MAYRDVTQRSPLDDQNIQLFHYIMARIQVVNTIMLCVLCVKEFSKQLKTDYLVFLAGRQWKGS